MRWGTSRGQFTMQKIDMFELCLFLLEVGSSWGQSTMSTARPRAELELVAWGSSRELFTANRFEPELEWIFANRNCHEQEPDLFWDPLVLDLFLDP